MTTDPLRVAIEHFTEFGIIRFWHFFFFKLAARERYSSIRNARSTCREAIPEVKTRASV